MMKYPPSFTMKKKDKTPLKIPQRPRSTYLPYKVYSAFTLLLSLLIACQPKGSTRPTYRTAQNLTRAADLPSNQTGIVEVYSAAPGILVVVVQTNSIETGEPTNPANIDTDPSNWKVNGNPAMAVYRYSIPYDEQPKANAGWPLTTRHRMALKFGNSFSEGSTYQVSTPYGNTSLTFNSRSTYSPSIHCNQVGYSSISTLRYCNLGVYMGTGGTFVFPSLPTYRVYQVNGSQVASGTATDLGPDPILSINIDGQDQNVPNTGERVYRISLTSVPEGGPYFVTVDGVGSSRPFGIGSSYSRDIAKVAVRGLYHQRCGIALARPYTEFTRPACHLQTADTRTPWAQDPVVNVPAGASFTDMTGGWHDAGDFDERPFHIKIPQILLMYYEGLPNYFVDNQNNIPESGDGIPDFLNEAMWGVKFWEAMQITTDGDPLKGAVRMGKETNSHPVYGVDSAANDPRRYGTWGVFDQDGTPSITQRAAGIYAQASRLIRPYDPQRADALLVRMRNAWDYLQRTGKATGNKCVLGYSALERWLATGEEAYHTQFRNTAVATIVPPPPTSGQWPEQYLPGNGSANCQNEDFLSYVFTPKGNTNSALVSSFKAAVISQAEDGGYHNVKYNAPYPMGARAFFGWGATTAQGRYADVYVWASRFVTDPAQKQHYINMISQLMDYSLGLNPMGMSYYTGLGTDQPKSPLHLDSYFTKYGVGDRVTNTHANQPIGNVPGILIFGPMDGRSGASYQLAESNALYPKWDSLPLQRRWCDGWALVNSNEFSTWETITPNVGPLAFLAGPATNIPLPPPPPPPPPVDSGQVFVDASVPANDTGVTACPGPAPGPIYSQQAYQCIGTTWTPANSQQVTPSCTLTIQRADAGSR